MEDGNEGKEDSWNWGVVGEWYENLLQWKLPEINEVDPR